MRDPTLAETMRAFVEGHMVDVHVALPGIVVAYNAATQTADIAIATRLPLQTLTGDNVHDDAVTLPSVPVQWPSGGGYFAAFGLAAGDPVTVVCMDIAAGEYLETGEVSAPADTRRHSLGYCFAIPGGARPKTKQLIDAPVVGVVVGRDGADEQIVITDGLIALGKAATDLVALANKTDSAIAAVQSALDTVIAYLNTTGLAVAAGVAKPATPLTPAGTQPSVTATLVAAK